MNLLNVIKNLNPLTRFLLPEKKVGANNNSEVNVKAYPYDLPSNTGLMFSDSLTLSNWRGEKTSSKYVISMMDKIKLLIEGRVLPKWEEQKVNQYKGFVIPYQTTHGETKPFITELFNGATILKCNPSDFKSFQEFHSFVIDLFGEQGRKAIVKSIDFALTLPIPYEDVKFGLEFGKLRSMMRYLSGGKVQTFYIGKNHDSFQAKVYDKSAQESLDYPCTRVEVTRKGSDLKDLTLETLEKVMEFEPFKNLALNVVQFLGPIGLKPKKLGRYIELISCSKEIGFFSARRKFNDKGNFNRTFGGLVSVKKISPDFNELFIGGIKSYFQNEALQ